MLSGKAFVPGMGIETSCGGVARTVKLSTKTRIASSGEHRTHLETVTSPVSPARVSINEGVERSDLGAFKWREINAPHNSCDQLILSSSRNPSRPVSVSMSPITSQLLVQCKILNLNRFDRCFTGDISPMVRY